ncbi:hypothetical protein PUNSTDRAFT_41494 [Punctularia strigosozonata HHB-11173 SS5]|uniref:uncharacterized protein n=1 Tax=Punctularia strigosozonata (strain HHB-11173) TaxID=741275 RepID=UPI0004418536|nr:uncharacterized protein PUNSTDRAFT_41494 [Punctularia strigosozonata HHB-11173 SS5]EIN14220.1 hypothetical protein PUNSTDRAFT_41494 [Punctularia strigosozonata HHB-11173 SS5]
MDKFATLEPVRLYAQTAGSQSRTGAKAPSQLQPSSPPIGRLPTSLHLLILNYASIPTIPAYARCCRALATLARSEDLWRSRWSRLELERLCLLPVLDVLEEKAQGEKAREREKQPPTLMVDDDEFGDFASGGMQAVDDEMGEFVGGAVPSTPFGAAVFAAQPAKVGTQSTSSPEKKDTFRFKYIRAHTLLVPCARVLTQPSHLVLGALSALLPSQNPEASAVIPQAQLIHLLAVFLSPANQPLVAWQTLSDYLRQTADRFQAALLATFEDADTQGDEARMREAAAAAWEVHLATTAAKPPTMQQSQSHRASVGVAAAGLFGHAGTSAFGGSTVDEAFEMSRVWAEKREIFYEGERWRPEDNFTKQNMLAFDAMDSFMNAILNSIREDGSRAVRVFPPAANVLVHFSAKVANEVVSEYIVPLLTRARQLPAPSATEIASGIYLQATAGTFKEAWKIVDTVLDVSRNTRYGDNESGARAHINGVDSSSDAVVSREAAEDIVYRMFESNMDEYLDEELEHVKHTLERICKNWDKKLAQGQSKSTTFIASQNPALVKRNVLASFTNVLLLPVTIVPRAITTGVGAITTGVGAMSAGVLRAGASNSGRGTPAGYTRDFDQGDNGILFELNNEDDHDEDDRRISSTKTANASSRPTSTTLSVTESANDAASKSATTFAQFDLLLSLDVAIELIQADRESLKRCETFAGYPGHYGHRVRDTIEEIFVLLLQAMGDRHLEPGFRLATEQMKQYRPAEHEETTSVAPLMQFFELVHLGDMIQSMVQVHHIDKTDFLNPVVREKKKFENTLDDAVAAGLNAGTEVLMNQVEHIIITKTKPREYYPPEDAPLDLGPTEGCTEAVKCLDMHCKLLKDSTSKEVLEVFYQEVGYRLIAILQKHIKRQIISLNGGFQIIADLNTYHAFISSLKVPTVTSEFAHLKMLGHVYVVEDAKDLAQIVRDVTRYGGAYRPEDIYEFIQRRSDWKKIEKIVDKTMYNLSFKEDCVIA